VGLADGCVTAIIWTDTAVGATYAAVSLADASVASAIAAVTLAIRYIGAADATIALANVVVEPSRVSDSTVGRKTHMPEDVQGVADVERLDVDTDVRTALDYTFPCQHPREVY